MNGPTEGLAISFDKLRSHQTIQEAALLALVGLQRWEDSRRIQTIDAPIFSFVCLQITRRINENLNVASTVVSLEIQALAESLHKFRNFRV